mmetsp:Transcript_41605/g.109754  ORF Transcript_41605/g.109754 Transcript_41605/m.109754 type:complete len:100 (+) Transcript_41605:999-1298(+)
MRSGERVATHDACVCNARTASARCGGMAVVAGRVLAMATSHMDATWSVLAVAAQTRTMACGSSFAVAAEQRGVRATVAFAGSGRGPNGSRGHAGVLVLV